MKKSYSWLNHKLYNNSCWYRSCIFHDLLNLQNEKILSLTVDLDTQKDIEKFENFLNSEIKDNKIFKLDVYIPDFLWVDNK
ncbi:hypothetical protein [Campylobacter hominis]